MPYAKIQCKDKESLVVEGFSDRKRDAWLKYLQSSSKRNKLERLKQELLQFKTVFESAKAQVNVEYETLSKEYIYHCKSPSLNLSFLQTKIKTSVLTAFTHEDKELTTRR